MLFLHRFSSASVLSTGFLVVPRFARIFWGHGESFLELPELSAVFSLQVRATRITGGPHRPYRVRYRSRRKARRNGLPAAYSCGQLYQVGLLLQIKSHGLCSWLFICNKSPVFSVREDGTTPGFGTYRLDARLTAVVFLCDVYLKLQSQKHRHPAADSYHIVSGLSIFIMRSTLRITCRVARQRESRACMRSASSHLQRQAL